MASAPSLRQPESYEWRGSICLTPPPGALFVASSSSSGSMADSALPVFPVNSDDLAEDCDFGTAPFLSPPPSPSLLLNSSFPLRERHVFLCFKEPQNWPPIVDAAEFDRLPRFLANTIKARKHEMAMKTRLTMCEGRDGTESSNGDIMVFPDMIRYRGLTHFDVDSFVDEVLVCDHVWLPGRPEKLSGTQIFVCAHSSHDPRCGVSGFIVIGKLKDELLARGLNGHVFVRPCSHIGAHKHAGNLIVYSTGSSGEVSRRCYGCVTSDDVCSLLDELFGEGSCDLEGICSNGTTDAGTDLALQNVNHHSDGRSAGWSHHAQKNVSTRLHDLLRRVRVTEKGDNDGLRNRFYSKSRWWQAAWWFGSWERDDSIAVTAVIGAAASVVVAYNLYKIHSRH